ncbi:sensor histidine kinase [Microbacterium rhizomatis]|uniref:sensor histidine kinase n=1 Tax=Microbacterium rhizomatis TaxID=1631477 RepID=UPI001FE4B41A|nr:GAF domain-containing sensor histidine kinase [Microbacterium rhizomatis]
MTTAADAARVNAIADYALIGEPPLLDLQGLVQLASTICGVSTAVINIIDDRFQHQVASVGFTPATCEREDSMCAVVLEHPGLVVVPDAREDDRFALNPFVTGEIAQVRFYASSPVVTPAGVAIGTLCVFDEDTGDLTAEHSRALDLLAHQVAEVLELRRLTRELGESNQQLERFALQVSHDLRNPLTALSGFLELAADSPEMVNAPHAARSLARAESAADRMSMMVSDLLDYARVGGAKPRRVPVDLEQVVRAVLEDLDAALTQAGARVVVDASVEVTGDPTLLRALVQNLVGNAVKFSAEGGRAPRIEVTARMFAGGWRITVDDDGPGVPLTDRDRVFELMERGSDAGAPGLGIGLSTCNRIVESHGGRIGIEDSVLGGASVWVVLPAGD